MTRSTSRAYRKVEIKVPRTTCTPTSEVKLRRTRGEYWLEASCRATMVREKVVAATVMMLPAMAESTLRAAVGPPVKIRGMLEKFPCSDWSHCRVPAKSTTVAATIAPGTSQKVDLILSHRDPSRPKARPFLPSNRLTPAPVPYGEREERGHAS